MEGNKGYFDAVHANTTASTLEETRDEVMNGENAAVIGGGGDENAPVTEIQWQHFHLPPRT